MDTVFELHIWHRPDQSCFFLLQWQGRTQQLTASVPDAREVYHAYQRWQQRYLRYYEFSAARIAESGSLKPGTGDPAHNLVQAEQELIRTFQHWLAEGETRKIQQQIRDECSRLAYDRDRRSSPVRITLFLAVDSPDLARLPWETWELAPPHAPLPDAQMPNTPISVQVIRSAMQVQLRPPLPARPKKPRILVILGDDANLPLQQHWQALQVLKSVATLQRLTWSPQEDGVAIKDQILRAIADPQGWEVLIFVGHSQETAVTGGRVMITPNVVLATSELETALTQARDRGLQLAIFNSCSGLDIAHALTRLGLQVVAMREPIRTDVAQQFLHHLCQSLAQQQRIPTAVSSACQQLHTQPFTYPSATLLPLVFSPANVPPYQFAPPRWQQWLRSFTPSRQWLPTPPEAITLAFMLLITTELGSPVTDWLLDMRYLMQAVYYDLTNQLPPQTSPPVLLIGIDQESLDRAKTRIPTFTTFPMDRRYLAQIVAKTAPLKARVIGIDYFLDTSQPHERDLTTAMQTIVATKQAWFVFAVQEQGTFYDDANRLQWGLKGDVRYHYPLSGEESCTELCPFTYLLAVANTLSQPPLQTNAPQPHVDHQGDFQLAVSGYLRQWLDQPDHSPIAPLRPASPPLGLSILSDFALPTAHKLIPAWQFLNEPESKWMKTVDQPIILIAAFGYAQAEDTFPSYLSTQYWCNRQPDQNRDCSSITGSEVIAQNLRDLLLSRQIVRIPDGWMIGLLAILGKGVTLKLCRRSGQQRRRLIFALAGITGLYGAIGLQLYISASILMPWMLPSILFWIYLGFTITKTSAGRRE